MESIKGMKILKYIFTSINKSLKRIRSVRRMLDEEAFIRYV